MIMIFPEWTNFNIIFYSSLVIGVIVTAPAIYYGNGLLKYSKFHTGSGIPSRLGMLILYFSPIVALYFSVRGYLANASLIQWILFASIGLHFTKRALESLFLHKYSGSIGLSATISIAFFYSFASFFIGYLNRNPLHSIDFLFVLGFVFYIVGNLGNFIHHKILADLRKDSLEYVIPKGGLFQYVVCPHYLFEIFTWLGIFLFSRHLGALLVLGMIIAYLCARSLVTLKWYREKFAEFPKHVKAMIPFVL
jgi:very-long-chain enoyl-CoA reductase